MAKLADKKRNERSEIIKHLDLLVFGTGSSTLPEAIDKINESEGFQEAAEDKYGVSWKEIEQYLKQNRKNIPNHYYQIRSLTKEERREIVKHLNALSETAQSIQKILLPVDSRRRYKGSFPKDNKEIKKLEEIISYLENISLRDWSVTKKSKAAVKRKKRLDSESDLWARDPLEKEWQEIR